MSHGIDPMNRRSLIVSFSGLDGAGKSTQIESLTQQLQIVGLTTKQLAFWDNVVVGTRWREGFVHKAYGSEKGIGAPGKPVERRDKNVRKWYLTIARHALYFADAVHLRMVLRRAVRTGADVVIMDRYIYDELANLPLDNPVSRGFVRMIEKIVPRPDVAYLLDADPEAARRRKPEYPVDFMRECRKSYYKLAGLLGNMRTIPPLPLDEAKVEVVRAFMESEPARVVLLEATRKRNATSAA
jgi:thymidylate kinase